MNQIFKPPQPEDTSLPTQDNEIKLLSISSIKTKFPSHVMTSEVPGFRVKIKQTSQQSIYEQIRQIKSPNGVRLSFLKDEECEFKDFEHPGFAFVRSHSPKIFSQVHFNNINYILLHWFDLISGPQDTIIKWRTIKRQMVDSLILQDSTQSNFSQLGVCKGLSTSFTVISSLIKCCYFSQQIKVLQFNVDYEWKQDLSIIFVQISRLKALEKLCIDFHTKEFDIIEFSQMIGKLKNVKYLNLCFQLLEDNGTFGNEISKLKHLTEVNFVFLRRISQVNWDSLMKGLRTIPGLDSISLKSILLGKSSVDMVSPLSIGLQELRQLRVLNLNIMRFQIDNQGAIKLGQGLQNLKKLEKLQLDIIKNDIGEEGMESLSVGISHCVNLKELCLDLRENQLSSKSLNYLGSSITECQKIKDLKVLFQSQNITFDGLEGLLGNFYKFINLKHLKLGFDTCHIDEKACEAIKIGLQELKSLASLEIQLNRNPVKSKGIQAVSEGIMCLYNLRNLELNVSSCSIGSEGGQHLGKIVQTLKNLRDLRLMMSNNTLEDQGVKDFGRGIAQNQNIKILSISLPENQIRQAGAVYLCESVAKCNSLKSVTLYLYKNQLGGDKSFKDQLKKIVKHIEDNQIYLGI